MKNYLLIALLLCGIGLSFQPKQLFAQTFPENGLESSPAPSVKISDTDLSTQSQGNNFIKYSGHKNLILLNTKNQKVISRYENIIDTNGYYDLYAFDIWSRGEADLELLSHYYNVFEITTGGPAYDYTEIIRQWLNKCQYRSYLLAGSDWLTHRTNGEDRAFLPGEFEYDILGIKGVRNDVSNTIIDYPIEVLTENDLGYRIKAQSNDLHYYQFISLVSMDGLVLRKDNGINKLFSCQINNESATLGVIVEEAGVFGKKSFLSFDPLLELSFGQHLSSLLDIYVNYFTSSLADPGPFQDLGPEVFELSYPPSKLADRNSIKITTKVQDRRSAACSNIKGVKQVLLQYKVDDGEWNEKVMNSTYVNDVYEGYLPGGWPNGSKISYQIQAYDINDNPLFDSMVKMPIVFDYFAPTSAKNLVLVPDNKETKENIAKQYFNADVTEIGVDYDIVTNSGINATKLSFYKNVFEIANYNGGPKSGILADRNVIKKFVETPGNNYFLGGDSWLGNVELQPERIVEYSPASFENNIFGLEKSYNDINVDKKNNYRKTKLIPDIKSELAKELRRYTEIYKSELFYLPIDKSRIDGFWNDSSVTVDFWAGGADGQNYAVAASKILENGNKIAFASFTPSEISVDSTAFLEPAFIRKYVKRISDWFAEEATKVESLVGTPDKFEIYQNYPNPFNPVTTIEFDVPHSGSNEDMMIELTVFNVLGQKVAELIKETLKPGKYRTEFSGENLPSGVYIYKITGEFLTKSKKMMLLK